MLVSCGRSVKDHVDKKPLHCTCGAKQLNNVHCWDEVGARLTHLNIWLVQSWDQLVIDAWESWQFTDHDAKWLLLRPF